MTPIPRTKASQHDTDLIGRTSGRRVKGLSGQEADTCFRTANVKDKVKEAGEEVTSGKVKGQAAELRGETKGKASELKGDAKEVAGQAKGEAAELKGDAKELAQDAKGKVKEQVNKL